MPEILWWVCGSIGALLLLLVLWLVYRAQKFRRLQPIIFEYLSFQDVEAALRYIDDHPRLLTSDAEDFIITLLDRAWARGDAEMFVSGAIRLSLLAGCREYGIETARQMAAGALQAWLDASSSPSWQRALKLLGQLLVEKEASIHPEEVDEELVEAMSHIMDLLRPLAADEETIATQDGIIRVLRQILRQKAEDTLPSASGADIPITPSPSAQPRMRKRKRRQK